MNFVFGVLYNDMYRLLLFSKKYQSFEAVCYILSMIMVFIYCMLYLSYTQFKLQPFNKNVARSIHVIRNLSSFQAWVSMCVRVWQDCMFFNVHIKIIKISKQNLNDTFHYNGTSIVYYIVNYQCYKRRFVLLHYQSGFFLRNTHYYRCRLVINYMKCFYNVNVVIMAS